MTKKQPPDSIFSAARRRTPRTDAPSTPLDVNAKGPVAPAIEPDTLNALPEYIFDMWQRSALFFDTLRERGDNMLAHERAGQPPLLDFEHELVLDARQFDRPANYALLRITRCGPTHASNFERQDLRPVMVVDPRAGHGPGIGGFKHDSEVGVALHEGHPTYFAMFYPDPCPGQRSRM